VPPLRIAAINFLNPAPLLYNSEHPPQAAELATRYTINYTAPSQCAADLLAGRADLGLIPIASLTEDLAIVPGCTIASLKRVRSIQLIVRNNRPLAEVRTIATDTASRSSLAYTQILFRRFLSTDPTFLSPTPADPIAMLQQADAALLIGDPALLALEHRAQIESRVGPCTWLDLAEQWIAHTHLPWVAAVWAVRPDALTPATATQLIQDLTQSRDAGLAHREDLVREWTPRIPIPPATIRHYLNQNIHYTLTPDCIEAIKLFRKEAAAIQALPPLQTLNFLHPGP
jgi:chorismate dehydratase